MLDIHNDIMYRVTSGFIFSSDQSMISLPNIEVLKLSTNLKAVVQLVNIFNCLAMIEWSKNNKRLPDMTSNRVGFLFRY